MKLEVEPVIAAEGGVEELAEDLMVNAVAAVAAVGRRRWEGG